MERVNIRNVRTHLSRYLAKVERGEVIVLCRRNKPVAEIRAIEPKESRPRRIPGLLRGKLSFEASAFAPMSEAELSGFDRSPVFPRRV
jgi:antitoxin (DNA-binding transcriptional repressor) of toxin-antitoxin stability system